MSSPGDDYNVLIWRNAHEQSARTRTMKMVKIMLWRNPLGSAMIAPLAPALPPLGAGAHVMTLHCLLMKNSPSLCTGNTASSQLGRPSSGAKPLERQVT
jgi:hypothetical protein